MPVYRDPRQRARKRTPRKRVWALAGDRRWAALAKAFLGANPWCARCLARRRPRRTPAVHADHIVPAEIAPGLRYDVDGNVQALCRACHGVKGAHERRGLYYDYARRLIRCGPS